MTAPMPLPAPVGGTGEDVTVLPEASIRQMARAAQPAEGKHISRSGRCEMIGGGRFLDLAKMRRAMGAGRLASTEDREDGQPAFLEPGGDEAVAADEENAEEREPEEAGPNAVRQEADREQQDHRQPAECGGQDEEEGAFERRPKPVQHHARLEADEGEEGADGEKAEQPVRDDGKLATGARQVARLIRMAGNGSLQDAELPVRNRGMIRSCGLDDVRGRGRCVVDAAIGILSGTHGSLMRGQNGGRQLPARRGRCSR